MTAIQIGNTTELEVQYLLVKNGYSVFTPINDGCCVDLCFIENGDLKKVQVKSSYSTGTGFGIKLLKSGIKKKKKYTSSDVDYFATTYDNQLYLIPFKDVANRANVTLRTSDTNRYQYVPDASIYIFN